MNNILLDQKQFIDWPYLYKTGDIKILEKFGKAKLVSFRTKDGNWSFDPEKAWIGKGYTVALDSVRVERFKNKENNF